MVWYKPSTWFKSKTPKGDVILHTNYDSAFPSTIIAGKATLHCDNPQCDMPILASPVMYDESKKEIYHSDDCAMQANVLQTFKSEEITVGNVETISLEDAIKLFESGKLKQALPSSK